MRTFDPSLFNKIANEPSLRPTLGPPGRLDFTNVAADPINYLLVNDEGGFFVQPGLDGSYFEVHTIFPVGTNPRKVLRFAFQMRDYMFTETPCIRLYTQVPTDNIGADHLSRITGFVEIGFRPNAWKPGVGISDRYLTLDRWRQVCSTAGEAGKAFHSVGESLSVSKGAS